MALRTLHIIRSGAFLLALGLLGCALKKDDQLSVIPCKDAPSADAGVAAYTAAGSVYPLVSASCVQCHGAAQSPLFAVSNTQSAYAAAKPLVDFSNVDASIFVFKVSDGHCGANCATNGDAMKEAIKKWRSLEPPDASDAGSAAGNECKAKTLPVDPSQPGHSVKYVTATLPIPATLPTGNNFTTLTFSLSGLSPSLPEVNGAVFTIQIQRYSPAVGQNPATYALRNPRIMNLARSFSVKDVGIRINGAENPTYSHYHTVAVTVPAGAGGLVLSSVFMAPVVQETGSDTLTITFGELK